MAKKKLVAEVTLKGEVYCMYVCIYILYIYIYIYIKAIWVNKKFY